MCQKIPPPPHGATAPSGPGPSHYRGITIDRTFSGQVINPIQRPLPNNTQHSQQTNIHAPERDLKLQSQPSEQLRTHALDWTATAIVPQDYRIQPSVKLTKEGFLNH
jgi:hypothetical protein